MTTFPIANTTDALGGDGWVFDGSNFLVGPAGTGINIGTPLLPDQANSVNVENNLYINNIAVDSLFALLVSPTFTGIATFATLDVVTANVTTCHAAHYELNGVDIKAGRALNIQTGLIPAGFQPISEVDNQFAGLNQTITPAVTGLIYVLLTAQFFLPNQVLQGGNFTIFYGTGTPPTRGQSLLSTPNFTSIWHPGLITFPGQLQNGDSQNCPITGFLFFQGTVGTTYWVDIQISPFFSNSSANATVSNVNLALVEV